MRLTPASAAGVIDRALRDTDAAALAAALREADPAAFGRHAAGVAPWLGWVRAPDEMRAHVATAEALARECRRDGIRDVIVLGMGGSSLCPEVTRRTHGAPAGVALHVLDSTDPAAVAAAAAPLDPATTLHIVASKSGTTVEPLSFMAHFLARAEAALGPTGAASRFVAITDPGTPLGADARSAGWRAVLENPADIGGRYSALSLFGLVPMALVGVPLGPVLDRAAAARAGDDAARLGVVLGALGRAGRDKVTVLADPPLSAIGLWVEQLVAESLGKGGVGLVPVAQEPGGDPDVYGDDRVFVYHRMTGELDQDCAALAAAGHPVAVLDVRDTLDLGAVYMTWELATAAAGVVLDVNPFDQPDVQAAKDATNRVLARIGAGSAPADHREGPESVLAAVDAVRPGDYLALLAFCPPSPSVDRHVDEIRREVRLRTGAATTFGYGPRFLHSTGQLHKGGPGTAVVVQFVSDDPADLPVPGAGYTFGTLKRAQALGDAEALAERGRRLTRIGLGADAAGGMGAVARALREATG